MIVIAACMPAWVVASVEAGRNAKVTTVEVKSFGAVPGDGKSDAVAVRAAVEECRKRSPVTLKLQKGQYDFFPEDISQAGQSTFTLDGFDGLTIDGGGATFMFHGNQGAFYFANCKKTTVRSLTIDYLRPPFSLGKIVAVDDKTLDVEVLKEYPVTGQEKVLAILVYDPKSKRPTNDGLERYASIPAEIIQPQVLRLTLGHEFAAKPGMWILLRHAVYDSNAFCADRCTDFTLENITIHTTPGMAFVAGCCTNITVRKFRVLPRPGSGWPMSTTADGLHMSGNKGLITIEDCEFEAMGDDGANIKTGLYLGVTEKIDDRTVLAAHNLKLYNPPSPGDKVEFAHKRDLVTYATLTVESAEMLADGVHKIRFKEPLPSALNIGDLLGNATRVAKVRIRNCEVRNNRARGFLLQNRDVVVENCRFKNCTSGGIYVLTECFWFYESIGSRDVIIRNNTFENCGYWPGPCVLGAFGWPEPDSFSTSPGVHKNVVFEGNTIRGGDNTGILAAGVDGITIRNNTIEQVCRKPQQKAGNVAIYVMGSRKVSVSANKAKIAKQGTGCKSVFELGPGCEKDTISVKDNVGF